MNSSSVFFAKNDIRFRKILLFVLPTYLTTLFNTLYTIVDGMFVSKYVGTNALAAINIVYPIVNVLTGIALMFATGGSSLAAISAGAKNNEQANQEFTLSIIFSLAIGTTVSLAIAFNLSRVLTSRCHPADFGRLQNICIDLAHWRSCGHRQRTAHLLYPHVGFARVQLFSFNIRRHIQYSVRLYFCRTNENGSFGCRISNFIRTFLICYLRHTLFSVP